MCVCVCVCVCVLRERLRGLVFRSLRSSLCLFLLWDITSAFPTLVKESVCMCVCVRVLQREKGGEREMQTCPLCGSQTHIAALSFEEEVTLCTNSDVRPLAYALVTDFLRVLATWHYDSNRSENTLRFLFCSYSRSSPFLLCLEIEDSRDCVWLCFELFLVCLRYRRRKRKTL